MQPSSLEKRCSRLVQAAYTGQRNSVRDARLHRLASEHPFIQQLDAVFPASDVLQHAFDTLETKYWTCTCALNKFVQYAKELVDEHDMTSKILALGTAKHDSDDVWCVDTRGVLTLAVCKNTYERLGLVGDKLPWKGCEDTFVICVSLHQGAPLPDSPATSKWHRLGTKEMQTLEMWDVQRGPWQILFHHSGDPVPVSIGRVTVHEVKPFRSDVADVHIPSSMDLCNTAETSQLDWAEKMSALFEWVGMACLGAQRLKANDRVDPYVAVYTPPTPSRVGDITYMRWTGLLTPEFVQSVIDTSIVKLSASSSLISLTMHGVPSSPVAYLRPAPSLTAPLRAPRPESEDTLCLILSSEKEGPRGEKLTWALAKSIGQWDMQWG